MITRFTALILSLCVALPMCWCCVSVEAQPVVTGCCTMQHASTPEQSPQPSQDNCPCVKHEATRDVAATVVKAPVPELKLVTMPLWLEVPVETALVPSFETIAPRHDHGPPLVAAPLYQRNCALLL
jgi:hypothetical protein